MQGVNFMLSKVRLGFLFTGVACMGLFQVESVAQQTPPVTPKTVSTQIPAEISPQSVPMPQGISERPLSAMEAARIAIVHQPTIEAAKQAIEAAKARTQQTRSAALPSVTVAGSYTDVESLNTVNGVSSVVTGSPVAPGYSASAILRQLLFDFDHTRDLVRQSAMLEKSAQDSLVRTRYDLALQTQLAFYQYAISLRNLTISQDSVASRQKQLDLAKARLKAGLGLPSDVARAETSVAQGIDSLIAARNTAALARINLALIMGIDPRTPLNVDQNDAPTVAAKDMAAMVADALKRRPEIKEAEDNIKSARYGINAAKSTNAVSVGANIEVSSRGNTFPPGGDTFSVGVSLSWNPFDGGFTTGKVKEARANAATAVAALDSTKLSVISDVAQAYASMRTAEQRIVTATNEVANAREGLRIAEGRFASGLGIFLDIVDAETALETAQSDLTNAQLGVDVARANLAHAVGTPVP